jgi:hypothetical protein
VSWVWFPEGLVFGGVGIETGHVDVVDETWPEEGCVDHSGDVNVSSRGGSRDHLRVDIEQTPGCALA